VEVPPVSTEVELRAALLHTADDLLAYFERRLPVRDDAADLLSETMTVAWRRLAKLPAEPEQQRMWLFTIAAHVLANGLRSRRRAAALSARLKQAVFQAPAADHAEAHAVRDAVLRLHGAHRELIMLIHWDGFTIVEAAQLLGLNASTARSRYAAARDTLRRALEEHDPDCRPLSRG
jgi:RNA polymerase sigma-70 factor (ECF subfamily)